MLNHDSYYSFWGTDMSERQFTKIPEALLSMNKHVPKERKLTPTEMIVLIHLILEWQEKLQYPTLPKSFFADKLDIGPRQIQRIINSLELKGYVSRMSTYNNNLRSSNSYDLAGTLDLIDQIIISQHSSNKQLKETA